MPKSASTSLACTIGKITGLKVCLGKPRHEKDVDCPGFSELQKYHDNMVLRNQLFLKQQIEGKKTFFKEHILPTPSHLSSLRKIKKHVVILLRDPDHVFDAYVRHDKKHFAKYKKHIDLEQIEKDIHDFHDFYMWYASNKTWALVVYYKDLVKNYKPTMKKILKHYGLNGDIIPLLKKKYTGVGVKRLCS